MLQYIVLLDFTLIKLIITSIEGTQSFLDILLVIWNKHIINKRHFSIIFNKTFF
jgi:hypothetical protein